MFKTKLRSKIVPLLLVLIFCLTACTAKQENKFPDYSDFSFGGYLEGMAELREDVEKMYSMTDETWDYLMVDGRPGPRPKLKEPVTIGGEDYTLYFRFTEGPKMDSPSYLGFYYFVNTIESGSSETKNAAIQSLYDLLVAELGEPEEPDVHTVYAQDSSGTVTVLPSDDPQYKTVRVGLENGFGTDLYEEKWVLAENAPTIPTEEVPEDANVLLLATMSVKAYNGSGVELTVELRLLDSTYSQLARYAEATQARKIEEVFGK